VDFLKPGDPRTMGPYVLSRRLGAGGMGEVFFGWSPGGRPVAVKRVYPRFASNPEFRRHFSLEVAAARKVGGFHTAQVVDDDAGADWPWMVTAYVAGPPLNRVLAGCGALPSDSVRVLGAGLAEALVAIHSAGIIHGDLKPANILLAADGPRVIDFGIARAIDASSMITRPGTPGFMAPEVLTKQPFTEACDIFALGVVLAYAGGIHPFGEGPPQAVDYQVVHEEPDLGGLDPRIRGLVAECLAKNPGDRPTAEELLGRLTVPEPNSGWLPECVHDMIIACAPPLDSAPVDAGPSDHSRLLAEAGQAARALPDRYERAIALLHVATAASRIDPTRATPLLEDAWYRPTQTPETDGRWRRQVVEYLVKCAAAEVGRVAACVDPNLADRMLADIRDCSNVLSHRRMGAEDESAEVIITIAEAAAADPDRAERIARMLTDPSLQATAVARVAMALACPDPDRAGKLTRTLLSRLEQVARPAADRAGDDRTGRRWPRPKPLPAAQPAAQPPAANLDFDTARYWAVRVLTEIALGVGGCRRTGTSRSSADPGHFARTITVDGDMASRAARPAGPATGTDAVRAADYMAKAEQLASSIAASGVTSAGVATPDLRAAARCAVTTAAAQLDQAHAVALLAEAEQSARAIGADWYRLEALGQLALAAADTDPARTEQISRSLLRLPHKVGELALLPSLDYARAERIADAITDVYLRALVRAVLAVNVGSAKAESLLDQAMRNAGTMPGRVVEVAMVIARTDPARADQIARTLAQGPEVRYIQSDDNQYEQVAVTGWIRSAEYWRARALADLAVVSYQDKSAVARTAR
jgi:Protein kinase domain